MSEHNGNGANPGPEPGFDARMEPIRQLIAAEIGQQVNTLAAELKTMLAAAVGKIEQRIPDPTGVAQAAADMLKAEVEARRKEQEEAARKALEAAGARADAGVSGPGESGAPGLGGKLGQVSGLVEVVDKIIDAAFDKWMKFKQLNAPPENPFALANNLYERHPDVAQYFAGRWAPDPLASQWPAEAARAFEMGMRAKQMGMLQSWANRGAPTDPGLPPGGATTSAPPAQLADSRPVSAAPSAPPPVTPAPAPMGQKQPARRRAAFRDLAR